MNIWNPNIPFPTLDEIKPIDGIKHIKIHTAKEDGYKFLLGNAIVNHKDKWYASFAHSSVGENDNSTKVAELTSIDGENYGGYRFITEKDGAYSRSHGVYLSKGEHLWFFCPRAQYDDIMRYPDLRMEAYLMDENGEYRNMGFATDSMFWPMCEPFKMANGNFIMAGLAAEDVSYGKAAVAISDGDNMRKWTVVELESPAFSYLWGESTVLDFGDRLLLIARSGGNMGAAVSESFDFGKTWSPMCESNLPICQSKVYSGSLPNGEKYLVFNYNTPQDRDTLCIAVGKDSFERLYYIKKGYEEEPVYIKTRQWSYPYGFVNSDKLYVSYNQNKENAMLSIVPLSSIGIKTAE